jgi:hypothetical protein
MRVKPLLIGLWIMSSAAVVCGNKRFGVDGGIIIRGGLCEPPFFYREDRLAAGSNNRAAQETSSEEFNLGTFNHAVLKFGVLTRGYLAAAGQAPIFQFVILASARGVFDKQRPVDADFEELAHNNRILRFKTLSAYKHICLLFFR